MSKRAWALRMVACLAALGVTTRLPAQATQEPKDMPKGQNAEIRFFVLDKTGNPVDTRNWTAAVEVTPEHGTARTIKLDQAAPASKEHSKAESNAEHYSNSPEKADGADGQAAEQAMSHKDRMLCGEAKKFEDGWCEMVVIWPKSTMQKGKQGYEQGKQGYEQGKQAYEQGKQGYEQGKEALEGKQHEGFMHDHGAAYFKAPLDLTTVKDAKTNTVNFSAKVTFTTPAGDTKYVKGFTYPAGFIDGAIGRLIEKDFYDTSKFDHDMAVRAAHRSYWTVEGVPPLSFAKDKDRQEYEKARENAQACAKRLKEATGKDIQKAADECKSALKEFRSQAGDAQGAMFAY